MTDRSLIGVGRGLGALRKGFAPLNERFGGLSPRAEALHPLKDGLLQSGHESHPQLCDITDFLRAAGEAVGAGVRRLHSGPLSLHFADAQSHAPAKRSPHSRSEPPLRTPSVPAA